MTEAAPSHQPDYLTEPFGGFLDRLASDRPAPAAGSAAAAAVAMAAGLAAMAGRRAGGRVAQATDVVARAEALRSRVAPLVVADAAAYGEVLSARRDGGPVEGALSRAAVVPAEVADVAAAVADLAATLAEDGNPTLAADAAAAAMLAEAGARAAALLVRCNLAGQADARVERAAAHAAAAERCARRAAAAV